VAQNGDTELVPLHPEAASGQRGVGPVGTGAIGEPPMGEKSPRDGGQHRPLKWTSPAVVGVFIAALGLFGNMVVAWYDNASSRDLQREKQQSDLILQAVIPNDEQKTCVNLQFYIGLGLLDDRNGKISRVICSNPIGGEVPLVGRPPVISNAGGSAPLTGGSTVTTDEGRSTSSVPGPPITANMIRVQRMDSGGNFIFAVSFVVPSVPNYNFDMVKVYGMKIVANQRSNEQDYAPVTGNWKAGDHVSFSVKVPKEYTDATQGWYLTFCVGSRVSCYPSPNLLRLVEPPVNKTE
jgi:hypothetical protein